VRNTGFPLSWQGLARRWTRLTLAGQFLIAASTVVLAGMLVIGLWVSRQIEEGVITNSAATTALYVDSVIAPLFPKLGNDATLSEGVRRALDETLSQAPLGKRLAFFKIWGRDGLVAYSSEPGLIGKRFDITENLKQAWAGKVTGEFDELSDEENATERVVGLPLLEIYSPIREPWSGRVVAVAEFYEVATDLKDSLLQAQLKSWLIVAAVTICMMALLFGIVGKGSSLIQTQRAALEQKISDLSSLLKQNEMLRLRVEGASRRAAELNERYLRKISADLHDGPAQFLALASLRLDSFAAEDARSSPEELSSIRSHLDEAMQEIRSICRGLVLPQIEEKSLPELLREVVGAHEQRTGTAVELETPEPSPKLDHSQKICVYRFVQEGLNNAFRHANAAGQRVSALVESGRLRVTVSDRGKGLGSADPETLGLGLAGLRERIESLGGEFHLGSSALGTRMTMQLKIEQS
jgi:signal transduction histidine kinase